MTKQTVAGRLLDEVSTMHSSLVHGSNVGAVMRNHFSNGNEFPWQLGSLRFQKLVGECVSNLDIFTADRAAKYEGTISNHVLSLVQPERFTSDKNSLIQGLLTEIVFERLENFHESLLIAGRFHSIDQSRASDVIGLVDGLIEEMEAHETEIDSFVLEKLRTLRAALSRYALFGDQGVRDLVSEIIGSVAIANFQLGTGISVEAADRVRRIMTISKGVMDAFVYVVAGAEAIEWVNSKALLIGAGN
jgi:hypothetical protein